MTDAKNWRNAEVRGAEAEPAPWERLAALEAKILAAVPPIEPGPNFWLYSDSTESYCYAHAWEARWFELQPMGPPPPPPSGYGRSDFEETMDDGIGGTIDGESDHTECCSVCGEMLSYILTSTGVGEEFNYFSENPISPDDEIGGALAYTLSRIFLGLPGEFSDPGEAALGLKLAEDVWAAIEAAKTGSA